MSGLQQQPNAGDAAAVGKQKRDARSVRKQELADFRAVLKTQPGRRLIWRLLEKAGIFRTSFTGNSTTFFNEGMRNMGLIVMADLNEACPEMYQVMVNEARPPVPQQQQQEDTKSDD